MLVTRALYQICRRSHVASPSLLSRLPNLTCTFLQTPFNPLLLSPFGIINIFQRKPGLESFQKMCKHFLPVQGSISNLFETVLCPDNGPMLLLQKPSHPYFLPLVQGTKVGLCHHFGKLLQGEFRLLQADWGFAFGTTQVQRIVAHLNCIIFVIGNIRYWGQIHNPRNICPVRSRSRLRSFGWEANGGLPRCARKLARCSAGGRCRVNDWSVSRWGCRHSR